MKRGLIIGRFQPFHLGHLALINQVFLECKELIIVIGSSQTNFTIKNPFTAGERLWMIHNSLLEYQLDLKNIYLIPVVKDENNASWFGNLKSMIPPFEIIFTGNEFVKLLIQNESIETKKPSFINKDEFNGSHIRRLIIEDDLRWKDFVSKAVLNIIEQIKGIDRIKLINKTFNDSPSSD